MWGAMRTMSQRKEAYNVSLDVGIDSLCHPSSRVHTMQLSSNVRGTSTR